MDDHEAYLDYLMEEMKDEQLRILLASDDAEKYVPVSSLMLREIIQRADAASSEEEGNQIVAEFMKNVIQRKITPYH